MWFLVVTIYRLKKLFIHFYDIVQAYFLEILYEAMGTPK